MDTLIIILVATVSAATPLVIAALGELVSEKCGVLNLGVEGMMLVGAVCGFAVAFHSGSLWFGIVIAAVAGALMAALFALLVLVFQANQVASGLALTIFGVGLSSYIGISYTGVSLTGLQPLAIPLLSELPIAGRLLFSFDALVYASLALLIGIMWFLYRTKAGLVLRGIGENPDVAHAIGYSVLRIRFLAVLFGGACAGLGGGYLSLVYTPLWVEEMTAGRGWIVLALVVFATWRPLRVAAGAYLFGGITIIQFHLQGAGVAIASQWLSMLPYLATIIVLVVISREAKMIQLHSPMALGKPYRPDR